MSQIEAVTFDARGTLIQVRNRVGETYAAVARRHGADLSVESVEAAFQEVFPTMPPLAFPPLPEEELHRRENEWWRKLVRRILSVAGEVDDFDAFFQELFDSYRGAECWKPYPEAATVLCLLRSNGYRLGLVSNFDSRIEEVLVSLSLSLWLHSVVFSSRTGVAKPHPDIFRRSLRELGTRPERTLHIGDSLEKDWQGATDAGMQALLLDRDGVYATGAPDGVEVVRDLEDVLQRLSVGGFEALTA